MTLCSFKKFSNDSEDDKFSTEEIQATSVKVQLNAGHVQSKRIITLISLRHSGISSSLVVILMLRISTGAQDLLLIYNKRKTTLLP